MAKPVTRVALCTTKDCPWPTDEALHHCWVCGDHHGSHQHWPKKSQGGKTIVASLCQKHHSWTDNEAKAKNSVKDGIYTYVTNDGVIKCQRDVQTGTGYTNWETEDTELSVHIASIEDPTVEELREFLDSVPTRELPAVIREDYALATQNLSVPGVLTPVSWESEPLAFTEWEAFVDRVQGMGKAWQFWLGDALCKGEDWFGETYAQVLDPDKLPEQTVKNVMSVARRVPTGVRVPALSWSHHRVVAKLEPEEQSSWLSEALERAWTSSQLAKAIRGEEPEPACEHAWVCSTCGEAK